VIDEAAWDQETTAWIDGLDPDTEYGVRIAAVSDAGMGEFSELYTFTTTHNSVQRIFGADRYETAVRVSQDAFPFSEINAAFVAGGRNFPDALAAAAVAGSFGGPVLLTLPNSISTSAQDELDALKPEYVFGAGGTSVISSKVFAQAASAATLDSHQFAGANHRLSRQRHELSRRPRRCGGGRLQSGADPAGEAERAPGRDRCGAAGAQAVAHRRTGRPRSDQRQRSEECSSVHEGVDQHLAMVGRIAL
jgi:hypothetical protein